jgi:hypothetical protein
MTNKKTKAAAWQLDETYSLVKKIFGANYEERTRESAQSIVERQAFAHFHYTESLRLTRNFERRHLPDSLLIDLYGKNNKQKRMAFELYILKAGAHAMAAIQSVHSLPDILAHTLYFASGQDEKQNAISDDRKIGVRTVTKTLKDDSMFQSLSPLLESAHFGDSWNHLSAVANLSKHRRVVRSMLNEDWTGKREQFRELHIRQCEYDGRHYPSISLQELLRPEYDRLSILILKIGNELNNCLRQHAT